MKTLTQQLNESLDLVISTSNLKGNESPALASQKQMNVLYAKASKLNTSSKAYVTAIKKAFDAYVHTNELRVKEGQGALKLDRLEAVAKQHGLIK